MTTCAGCGVELSADARFCSQCGSPVTAATPAEYKQVTVLFADVVRSMDIAAALGPERLREVMGGVFDLCARVVTRYGGTVDKFTGDGIMAIFGAPVALEDHAFRACLSALDIQRDIRAFADHIEEHDGIALALRIGLNSGQVIAGDIGSSTGGYTAIGTHVGMAQRMEAAARPGEVMLSEATARLVEANTELGTPESVSIKGSDIPLPARQLIGTASNARQTRDEPALVGRVWELSSLEAMIDEAISGRGCLVSVAGPAGIGKSRLVRETVNLARGRGVAVYHSECESHTTDIAFHACRRLLRSVLALDNLTDDDARSSIREQLPDAEPLDVALLEDLLGVHGQPEAPPEVAPDARRRRLAALLNTAALARTDPAMLVVEDVHWIDAPSEAMLADFVSIITQTPIVMIISYRPEYRGLLAQTPEGQKITLAPLRETQTTDLLDALMGVDPSTDALKTLIVQRASGNPFFAQEIVRDLAERGIFEEQPGAYLTTSAKPELGIPSTLQATIAARIDRLAPTPKRTLNAAAVLGTRFDAELLERLVNNIPELQEAVDADLVEQVAYTPRAEYAFRHPLIRDVAYQSQLVADRADLHRRAATVIAENDPDSLDRNAALIAEHLDSAGDLVGAFGWHMRAGDWLATRDIAAARSSWQRASELADSLAPESDSRRAMQLAARVPLSGNAWRVGSPVSESGYDELRELAVDCRDREALAVAMFGQTAHLAMHYQFDAAANLSAELLALAESIDDVDVVMGAAYVSLYAEYQTSRMDNLLARAQRVIDLCAGDLNRGNRFTGSPLVSAMMLRGVARCAKGVTGWREDLAHASQLAHSGEPTAVAIAMTYKHIFGMGSGVFVADQAALDETAELLESATRFADDFTLSCAQLTHGFVLTFLDSPLRDEGFDLLDRACAAAADDRYITAAAPTANHRRARHLLDSGDVAGALELARSNMEFGFASGDMITRFPSTSVVVDALLQRGQEGDIDQAAAAIDRLAAAAAGYTHQELALLHMRALVADARGDRTGYCDLRDSYRNMARSLGFAGHLATAEAMP